MVVRLRTMEISQEERQCLLDWLVEHGAQRVQHGILVELVLEPASGEGETVLLTAWLSQEDCDGWTAFADRSRFASSSRNAADSPGGARYQVAGGYFNLRAFAKKDER